MKAIETQDTERRDVPVELPHRILGKTGERVPVLGLGTGPGGFGLADKMAVRLYHRAIDLGITYIDTAPGYDRAQVQLGEVMRERRDQVFLATKASAEDGERALEILEQNLKDLQTEQVDLAYVHSMGNKDVDRVLGPDGSLAGLREAQRRGWTRYVGFTAHDTPWKSARALREAEVDVVMLGMNFADRHTYHFEEEVLPLAATRNVGVAAMKVYGGALDMEYKKPTPSALAALGPHDHGLAMRYALDLPGVSIAVIGVYNEEELVQNVAWARNPIPLAAAEEALLKKLGPEIAAEWGEHYGPVA